MNRYIIETIINYIDLKQIEWDNLYFYKLFYPELVFNEKKRRMLIKTFWKVGRRSQNTIIHDIYNGPCILIETYLYTNKEYLINIYINGKQYERFSNNNPKKEMIYKKMYKKSYAIENYFALWD